MQEPRIPENESERLQALRALDVLDTPAEARFDRITRVAQRHFQVPIALVSIVDAERQWFKSKQGLDACETSRGISFCGHAILAEDIFYIPNALEDPRFADNPLVTGGPAIRFYAGAPLHAPNGQRIGTLCIIDSKPRQFSREELSVLRDLADGVEAELERTHLLASVEEAARLALVAERTDNAVIITDAEGRVEWVNHGFERITGYTLAEVAGKKPGEVLQGPDTNPETVAFMREKIGNGEAFSTEVLNYHKNGTPYWLALSIQPIIDDQGHLIRFVAIESDISERKRGEQRVQEQNKLLDAISRAQSQFIAHVAPVDIFKGLLESILAITGSEYGFIGEVMRTEDGRPYIKTHGITNIAWNETTRRFYEENAPTGLEFHQLDNLFGHVVTQGVTVIANDPAHDPRRGGLPNGHPALSSFLGMPFYEGEQVVGMIGVANRAGGYDESLLPPLEPLLTACKNIIESLRLEKRRLQAESALQSSENRIRAIIDTVVDGIVTIDARGSVQSFNPAAERIFGYRAEQIIGHNVNMLMPEPYHAAHDGYLHNYLSTGEKKIIGIGREVIGRRQDGSTFPMELAVSEMGVNGERMFTGIVRDITQRKAMEAAAKRYEAIIQSSDDAIMSKTLDGIITSWNPGAERLFGYRADEMVGRPMLMLFPPEREAEEHMILGKIASGEKVEPFETQRLRKDGSKVDISVTISPIVDDTGRVIGASKIARDISERKRLDRMKSEFVSTVSHELRTPLTSIRGALGLVLGKFAAQLPDKARTMLEMAERNSERLTLLINDILDLEKIESGRMEFEFADLDLVSLARRAMADNEGYAHKHGVRLVLDTPLAQAPVSGDGHRLLQVFANLISNAVKYSPPEGEVEISVTEHNGGFRVAVRDHGQGIPEAFRNSIFQRFAQADSSDTREKGGTGLGLSITKAIVERHEGDIGYESEVGKGTVFHFNLPAAQPAIQESPAGAVGDRVLICEDNADVAAILAGMLKPEGVVSDIAATAAAARTLLAKHAYRLLLLDLTLPDGDGLDFLRELRGAAATADLPVIVVSGRAEEGRMAFSGDAVAVVDWLQKPLDRARLERALREALRHKARPRILHVEDDPDIVQITQALLEDMAELSHVATLRGAREMFAEQRFDLVILDIGLADGSGLDLLDELKARCPVVIFSAQIPGREITEQVTAALTKSMTSNEELLETIKNVLRG